MATETTAVERTELVVTHDNKNKQLDNEMNECNALISNNTEWYQVINRHIIEGPYNVPEIIVRVIRREFNGTLWVRKCRKSAKWYKLNLDELGKFEGIICADDTFINQCPKLHLELENTLTLNIYRHNKYPGDETDGNKSKCCCLFDGWTALNWCLFIFMCLHINISIIFAGCWRLYCIRNKTLFVFSCIMVTMNAIATSIIICYFGFIHNGIYNEIQSWMIAYIAWIAIIMIQWAAAGIREHFKYNKVGIFLSAIRMKILGISLQQKKILFTNWRQDLWIIPITSLLPSAVIGFLANYFLEEKFLLQCDSSLNKGDICYEDGRACCIVISSYDINNLFDFGGKLASNILASFGVIRIVAWFMVKKNKKIRHMVQKKILDSYSY